MSQNHGDRAGQSNEKFLGFLLKSLSLTTMRLRALGLVAFIGTLANIGVLAAAVVDNITIQQNNQISVENGNFPTYLSRYWLVANIIIFLIVMFALALADLLRRRGDDYFQELSNSFRELQDPAASKNDANVHNDELAADARFKMRSFVSAAEPPLIRGKYGLAIYALINLLIVGLALFLYSQAK